MRSDRKKSHQHHYAYYFAVVCCVFLFTAMSAVQAQDNNLLNNPSFEGAYSDFDPEPDIPDCRLGVCTTAQMAAGWLPWWVSHVEGDPDWKNRMPEYKPATAPYTNRIHSGLSAQQLFTFHSTHVAGLWQRVQVPTNANLKFNIWGHAWSDADEGGISIYPTPVNMRVGIDPTGGTNPFSPAIVWSGMANVYDNYALFSVEAAAQGDHVTVFTYSAPDEARKHNDIYWDDASLVATGGTGAVLPPAVSGSSGGSSSVPNISAPVLGPAPTPNADGEIVITVQAGDSLWSIAARNGITIDELLTLNGGDLGQFIQVGDELLVGYGEPGAEGDAAAVAEEGSDEASTVEGEGAQESAEPTDTDPAGNSGNGEEVDSGPLPPATATPDVSVEDTGTLCFTAFDDTNINGLYDPDEALREAVAITVSNDRAVMTNYITDGVSEPFCVDGVASGNYRVTRSKLPRERLTTPGDWAVTLTPGGQLNMDFGSVVEANTVASTTLASNEIDQVEGDAEDAVTTAQASTEDTLNTIVIVVVVIAVLLLIGVLVMILSSRKTTA